MNRQQGGAVVHKTFRDLKGRYAADVEVEGVGRAMGFSWSSYALAIADAIAYIRSEAK